MDNKIEFALGAIKASVGTDLGEYGIDLFVSHHLGEISTSTWLEVLGKKVPSSDDIISALVLTHAEDDVYDFTLPRELTNYVVSVTFDEKGQVVDISMES